jgi:riboflavin synthase
MFTGIVQALGTVESVEAVGGDMRLRIATGSLDLGRVAIGDSISVSGACLTVVELTGRGFAADVSRETLALTTLGSLVGGSPVNLEPALRAGDALGGHYVTGHVDGLGRVVSTVDDARSWRVVIEVPAVLARFVAPKGSITVEGVSLTVNEVDGREFGVNLIPHTRAVTTLGTLVTGSAVNLEIDVIARYVDRLMARPAGAQEPAI